MIMISDISGMLISDIFFLCYDTLFSELCSYVIIVEYNFVEDIISYEKNNRKSND